MSKHNYPQALYRADQARKIDLLAIQSLDKESKATSGLSPRASGYRLMLRAGEAVVGYLLIRDPKPQHILIICGAGNNAGDGYVAAKLAQQSGIQVDVISLIDADRLQGEAMQAVSDWKKAGGKIKMWSAQKPLVQRLAGYDCIIDALVGTGLSRDLEGEFADAVKMINAANVPVIAVDIPSGLHADLGVPMSLAVHADVTITFIVLKQGLLTGDARDYVGDLIYNDLGVSQKLYRDFEPASYCIDEAIRQRWLKPRKKTAYKQDHGHLLMIGGDMGMSGAIMMAAKAAMRCGAGLVSVATRSLHASTVSSRYPELMSHAVESAQDLKPLLKKADVIVIGPGLGQSQWAKQLLDTVLSYQRPLLVDADALNLLSVEAYQREQWILTPHPGEAARLLSTQTSSIQSDRHRALHELIKRYKAVVVLKGAATVISGPRECIYLCDRGNPGMATAGMGDILSGVIGSLMVQGTPLLEAAKLGVLIHASAADLCAAEAGQRGLNATDLLPFIRRLVNTDIL